MCKDTVFRPSFGNRPERLVGRDEVLAEFAEGIGSYPGSRVSAGAFGLSMGADLPYLMQLIGHNLVIGSSDAELGASGSAPRPDRCRPTARASLRPE